VITVSAPLNQTEYTEAAALSFLDSLDFSTMKLGLGRMQAVLETLGNPQEALEIVHIAGTNGKGSTTAMLSSVLQTAGLQTGRFISPHLVSVRERIAINGKPISPEAFANAVFGLRDHLESRGWPREDWPTYFEYLNILAYQYFVEEGVEISVFETGLGGRLDSTNIIKQPRLTVITSIGLDHTMHLGNTLAEIAFEKAGILKAGVPVVLGVNLPNEARRVIHERADSLSAPITEVDVEDLCIEEAFSNAEQGLLLRQVSTGDSYRLSLSPPYQRDNAAVVFACIEELKKQGFVISQAAVGEGLAKTYWPARFQVIKEQKLLLDGSHNVDGFESLANALQLYYAEKPFIWLLSLRNNRPIEALVQLLCQFPKPVAIILTTGQPSAIYHSPETLLQALKGKLGNDQKLEVIANPVDGLKRIETLRAELSLNALGIITGSLYTAGAILEALKLDEAS
jgi:dihydrofolate synthase/folylpolyglutamate synthase